VQQKIQEILIDVSRLTAGAIAKVSLSKAAVAARPPWRDVPDLELKSWQVTEIRRSSNEVKNPLQKIPKGFFATDLFNDVP
jgi:hypothetical protein